MDFNPAAYVSVEVSAFEEYASLRLVTPGAVSDAEVQVTFKRKDKWGTGQATQSRLIQPNFRG